MGISVGDLFLDLKLNTNTLNSEFKGVQSLASKYAKKVGMIIGGAFTSAAIVSFSKDCLELGSNLSEVQNIVDVVFPSMNKQIDLFSKNAMKSFGLSETIAKQFTGTYGSMAKAFGFSEKEAYNMSTTLTGLAGDVASFYNLDPTEAYTKLKSVFSGETETLKDLGIVMTQNALDQYALANGFGKTTSAMSEQEKVALRLSFVTNQLSAASGDFARTSDSWANKVRVLSLNFQSLKATIGQGLINVLSPVIDILNGIIARVQKVAEYFVTFTSLLSSNKKTSSTLGSVSSSLASASVGASNLANNITDVGKAVKKLGALASFDELNVLNGKNSNDAASGLSSGINLGGLDLNTGISESIEKDTSQAEKSINKIMSKLFDFTNSFKANGSIIISICSGILSGLVSIGVFAQAGKMLGIIKEFKGLTTFGWGVVGTIASITSALVYLYQESDSFKKLVNEAVSNFGSILSNLYSSILKPLFMYLVDVFNSVLVPLATFISTVFVKAIECISTVILSFWNNILAPLTNFLISVFGIALQGVIDIWNGWKPGIELIFNSLNWVWNNMLSPLATFVTGVFTNSFAMWGNSIAQIIPNVKGVFQGLITFITGAFTGDWKKAWEGVKQVFYNVVSGLANIFKTPINYIIDGINSFIRGINKIKIPDWVPAVGGKGFNIGTIPKLAEGGYVKANTPQLAMIGDNRTQGEIVSPEGKMFDVMMSALQTYGNNNASREDIEILVNILYEMLEAIKNLRLVVDGDSLNQDNNKRDVERALRTGKMVTA